MSQTLSERIALRELKKSTYSVSRNRSSFLAHSKEIQEALAAGCSVKSIWETLIEEGRIDFSYTSFRLYIRRLIHNEAPQLISNQPDKPAPKSSIPGFTFKPNPKTEDLF